MVSLESEGLPFWDWELPGRGKKSSRVLPYALLRGPVKKVPTFPHRKEAVDAMRGVRVSERRACVQAGMELGTYRYQGKGAAAEPEVRARIREFTRLRPRFGSPRLTALVHRELEPASQAPSHWGHCGLYSRLSGLPAPSTLRGKVLTSRRRPEKCDWRGKRASCGVRSGAIPEALTKRLDPAINPQAGIPSTWPFSLGLIAYWPRYGHPARERVANKQMFVRHVGRGRETGSIHVVPRVGHGSA